MSLWNHFAREGQLFLTLGKVSDEAADHVCRRIVAICAAGTAVEAPSTNIADAIADQLPRELPGRS